MKNQKVDLIKLGWNESLDQEFSSFRAIGFIAGRVVIENRDNYLILTDSGEHRAEASGKLLFGAESPADLPKVGDWIAASLYDQSNLAIIQEILPRKTKLSRKVAGKKTQEQIIAANIDFVFVVQGLDDEFNLRRLERYLTLVQEHGIKPVVILNKIDLHKGYAEFVEKSKNVAGDFPVIPLSAATRQGIEMLQNFVADGYTYAFIGSSGVGKSTIINSLMGEDIQKTQELRNIASKGRHTTTKRELIVFPGGGLLIDTPGMRELSLWEGEEGVAEVFSEIAERAEYCRFSDCSHTVEKGCAVLESVENGEILPARYQSYLKLKKEQVLINAKKSQKNYNSKKRWKDISKEIKRYRRLSSDL